MDPARPHLPVSYEREVHLLDYLNVIRRRWRISLFVFLLVFCGVALKTLLQTPLYQAGVTMRVGAKPEAAAEILDRNRSIYFSIDSELQILQSYAVAERAAKKLAPRGNALALVSSGVSAASPFSLSLPPAAPFSFERSVPATPLPLLVTAATVPATWEPWPLVSSGSASGTGTGW